MVKPEIVRHGRPHRSYLATLRAPTKKDYEKLVRVCMEVLIRDELDVTIAFAYTLKLPDTFPRGILERKEGASNIHRIKARKLLAWLYEQGHTSLTLDDLAKQRIVFTKAEREFESLFSD